MITEYTSNTMISNGQEYIMKSEETGNWEKKKKKKKKKKKINKIKKIKK